MNVFTKIICLLIFTAASTVTAQAQYKVTGTVADSATKKPLAYITINLRNNKQTLLKTTLTKQGGAFALEGVQPAKCSVTAVALGYRSIVKEFVSTDSASKAINLDTLYMAQKVNDLKEVVITADRPIIKQQADRIIYDLQADPESKGNNVLTMMRKVPFISLDANNNLLLKGNSSFKVLINGKPSGMLENNLKAVLQSIPASTIQSIEVITNPPAKYDAEGLAGIINIITNKKVDNGFKGSLNANEYFPVGGPGLGLSFSAKQGKLGATGYGGASIYNAPDAIYQNSRSTFGNNATRLLQNGSNSSKSRNGYFGTELSYDIDSLNLLSVQFNINGNHADGQNNQNTALDNQAGILQSYGLANTSNSSSSGLEAGINYQLDFKTDKSKLLTFAYRYNNYNNAQLGDIAILNPVNYPLPNYRQDNSTGNTEQTFQADYVQQVKKLSVEGGVKGIWRNNKSDFKYLSLNPATGQFEAEADFSDRFNYHQNVFSAYNSYRYSLNSWNFSGGLRIEQTLIDADFIASATKINQNFFNVIPNLSVNKEFKDKSSLSLGFNQRIKRPNIRRLNPFIDRSNPSFETTGNPLLRPVLNNNFQLTYNNNSKLAVTAALSYGFINNIDLRITTVDTVTNITRSTYQNTGKANRLGLDYNLNYPVTNKWNVSANGNVENFIVSGLAGNTLLTINKVAAYVSVSSGYRFDKGWRVNANLALRSRSITDLQGTANAFATTAFSVNKELIKNKLTLAAAVNNPFNKYRNNITTSLGPDFIQVNNSREYFRSFNFSLNYNFGQLKSEVKKSSRGINNDDVSK